MRTDPLRDAWQFLSGATGDQLGLGWGRWVMVALFSGLLVGSIAVAVIAWRSDPAQRHGRHLGNWLFRLLLGTMWFQGSLWKLPLPEAGGLTYWTEQMAQHAAIPAYGDFVRQVMLPHMAIVDPLVFLAELGLAASFMLGLLVRPVASLGVLYTLGLWLGLYRHPGEWPWEYVFLAIAQAQLALHDAGRSLGLDGLLWRTVPPPRQARVMAVDRG